MKTKCECMPILRAAEPLKTEVQLCLESCCNNSISSHILKFSAEFGMRYFVFEITNTAHDAGTSVYV